MNAIWQLGMHFDPSRGGADRYFATLIAELAASGVPVRAAAFGEPVAEGQIGLGPETAPLLSRRARLRAFGATLRREVRGPAVLATHFALYAAMVGRLPRGTRHVVHFHGPWAMEARREGAPALGAALKAVVERFVYRRAHRVIALSRAFGDLVVEEYGVAAERVRVIPGFVDLARFAPGDGRRAARARLGWPEDRTILLCARRLVARTGVPEVIEAFGGIAGRFPEADLYLAGRGPLETRCRELVAALGLGERVRFTGFVPEGHLADAYRAADLSVVPSQALEGFGLAAAESIACGTPVLVTPCGGLPEAVGGCGLVADGCESGALARGLADVLAGSWQRPLAEECARFAASRFAPERIVRAIREVYDE